MGVLLITGSSGLIGSEVAQYFDGLGWDVHGIDNNQREVFFGAEGSTRWNQKRLEGTLKRFTHHELDIRDRNRIADLIRQLKPRLLVHAASQPSHDKAALIPFDDFETNAVGTLNLIEAVRQNSPETIFVHFSTNKVYGDAPNRIRLKELEKRWELDDPKYSNGIPEDFPVDQSLHSLFGVSKLASDLLVQEYGRYFGIRTCCLRGGCLTGPCHTGVELHGFLSYLVKCNLEKKVYKIYGYKGKQVRDNIHAYDVARFIDSFAKNPRVAAVYNVGGGRENSCSILEAFDQVSALTGIPMQFEYVDKARQGDHICYISDLRKIRQDYPDWKLTKSLKDIFQEIADAWKIRLH